MKCLVAALVEMGFAEDAIELHDEATNLYGYKGDRRADLANVIIRKENVGRASNDVGFVKQDDGTYAAIVSRYDSHPVAGGGWGGYLDNKFGCGGGFVAEVATRAAIIAAEQKARQMRKTTKRVVEGRKIRLIIT